MNGLKAAFVFMIALFDITAIASLKMPWINIKKIVRPNAKSKEEAGAVV
jgi:hypothetical protein